MTTTIWGVLKKALDNDELIEDAIDRLIAAHNADANAHLSAGGSLANHKVEDVIDHPVGSVLADKQTFTEIPMTTFFESLDGWYQNGVVDNTFGRLGIVLFGDSASDPYVYNELLYFPITDDGDLKASLWQIAFQYTNAYTIGEFYVGIGISDAFTGDRICFKIVGGNIYFGYFHDGSGGWSSSIALSPYANHIVRAQVDVLACYLRFSIDGVVVSNFVLVQDADVNFVNFGFYINKVGGTTNAQSAALYVKSLFISNPL